MLYVAALAALRITVLLFNDAAEAMVGFWTRGPAVKQKSNRKELTCGFGPEIPRASWIVLLNVLVVFKARGLCPSPSACAGPSCIQGYLVLSLSRCAIASAF